MAIEKKKAPSTNGRAETHFRKVQRAAILLKQVSDATRLRVILMLSEGEKHVGALCEELNQTQPAVSHHLALLRHGGIVNVRRRGKNNFYALAEMGEVLAKIAKDVVA
jgi:DNA-binding transcriptional ArsR family regulator